MEIPLWIILIPVGVIAGLTFLFLLFNVFHLMRYGIVGRGAVALIGVYLVSYAFVFILGVGTLLDVRWSTTVNIKEILPFTQWHSSSSYGL